MQCKYCENYVFLWKLSHSHVFFMLLNLVKDQGPSSTIAFFRITSKILKVGTCNFTIIERNIKQSSGGISARYNLIQVIHDITF